MSGSRQHGYGTLSALRLVEGPRAIRILGKILLGFLVVVILALIVVPWQQNVTAAGRVVAFDPFDRVQTIAAPVSGRVSQAWVIEGSQVVAGDPLLEIVDNDPSILQRLEDQRAALAAQLSASEEKVVVYRQQIDSLMQARQLAIEAAESQLAAAGDGVASARHGLDAARAAAQQAALNFRRQRELADEGLASNLEFEIAERTFKEARAREQQAQRALERAINDERAKRAELGMTGTDAQAGIESARAALQTAEVEASSKRQQITAIEGRIAQQTTQRITAPRSGTVYRLLAAPGAELVKVGDPLVMLVPETTSQAVELWVDGNNLPLIEEGREVRLQFEGWPAVQFAGWPSVAVGTFGGRVALVDPSDDGIGRFRILVVPNPRDDPWPEPRFLRQGVRANGFVLLDQVSIGYELWRQANGFPPTVAMQGNSERRAVESGAGS